MYYTSLPDHTQKEFDEAAHFSQFKQHNIIFNALAARTYDVNHVGCLSVKRVLSGEEWYGVNGRQLAARPGKFLILNNDQDYSCRVDTSGEVRIQSVFFKTSFAASVFRDTMAGEETLLDDPEGAAPSSLEFYQTLNDMDSQLERQFESLMSILDGNGYTSSRVDEHLVFLLRHLVVRHKSEIKRAEQVDALKPATRKEIYKRLCIAKDFLHSSFADNLDLDGISHTACLSSPQLVRQFKAVFHTTPYQYLTRIRLNHAGRLLRDSSIPVQEVTWQCGFENTSAFSRAFKAFYGVTPLHYRSPDNQKQKAGQHC